MRQFMRTFMALLAMLLVATQFVNCTEYSDDSSLYGNACEQSSTCAQSMSVTATGAFLTPRGEQPKMECTHDHIQIGGACELDGAVDSYIEYSLTDTNGNTIPFQGGATVIRESRCENGHYFLVIPRPPATIIPEAQKATQCSTASCFREYRLNSRLYGLKKNSSQFDVIATGPQLPLTFQLVIHKATGQNVCP